MRGSSALAFCCCGIRHARFIVVGVGTVLGFVNRCAVHDKRAQCVGRVSVVGFVIGAAAPGAEDSLHFAVDVGFHLRADRSW